MDRQALKVYPRRNTASRENENTTGNATNLPIQPLKDNYNIRIIKFNAEQANLPEQKQQPTQANTLLIKGNSNINSKNIISKNAVTNSKISHKNATSTLNGANSAKVSYTISGGNDRPLECLETLAQKAGITFDEKYDFAPWTSVANTTNTVSTSAPYSESLLQTNKSSVAVTLNSYFSNGNKSLTLEKSQSPAQQVAPGTVPLQILPEQLQQLQQYHQLQHGSPFAAIQVKQEFPTQQHTITGPGGTGTEIKHPGLLDAAAQGQLQQMQMQLAQTASDATGGGGPNSPATQHTPTSAGAVATMHQQHSATISTMSPMQLATATGQVTSTGDWAQGRTVQLMQPSTGFIYPHMLVPGNLIQSGLGQQPIQVITAGKPFQGTTPQMIATTQNTKQMAIGGNTGFSSGTTYAIPSSQSPQTLLFSPVNVISQSPQQQQNILQAMTAAANAQQQQQQQQQHKGAVDGQKNLQQKVMQKVTTTTNNVQSATGSVSAAQQHQQQSNQQCVQVNAQSASIPASTTQIISPLQQTAGQPQPLQINATPWVQSVPFWSNSLQQLAQNPIIIRGTQADGTPGVFIQQPSGQTLQAQQPNQITLQCNVTQTPTKQRTQIEQLAVAKQPQTGQTHTQQVVQQQTPQQQVQQQPQQQQVSNVQQQQTVAQAHFQQQTAATVAAVNQQRSQAQILPQPGGTQIRPASSVSTQTAQNQSLLKQKMRTKQQAVRPALPAMKTEPQSVQQVHQQYSKTNTLAGIQQQITASVASQQQQQTQPTMHQVVTSAGNKMVVMSAGTPITIQNGQTLQQAVDKQQQQQQLQLHQLQKQQQQYLQQQLIQQQFAQIQLQHQQQQQQAAVHQHQQQQLQQVVAAQQQQQVGQQHQQQAQIQLQVGPQGFITAQHQQQLQNQLLQQQQQLQLQQQHQRDQQQSQSIIHQIVVQQSPQQQQQQQQQPQQAQQQITAVPLSVSSSTPASIATSQSIQQHVAYQTKTSNSLPTTSVVTISNQTGPLVTSTVGLSQSSSQLQQQQLIAATIAATHQQQQQAHHLVAVAHQQQPQLQHQQTVMAPPSSTAQNPILAMASMMNAASVGNLTSNTSLTTAVAMTSPIGNTTTTNVCSLAVTPTKSTIEPIKTVSSAPTTPSTVNGNTNTAISVPSTPTQLSNTEQQSKHTPLKSIESKGIEPIASIITTSSNLSTSTTNNCASQQEHSPAAVVALNHGNATPTETPQMTVQPMETRNDPPNESSIQYVAPKQSNSNPLPSTTQTTESVNSANSKTPKISNAQQSFAKENEKSTPEITAVDSSSPQEESISLHCFPSAAVTSSSSCTTSINTTSITNISSNFNISNTTSTTGSTSISVSTKATGPPPKSTPGATIVKVEKDLPKAMIKPNVLTHVIDGFIIQEANEPFPVTRKRYTDKEDSDELPQKKQSLDDASNNTNNSNNLCSSPIAHDMVTCEQCGKPEHKTKLKKKRFCSQACARHSKASSGEQVVQAQQQQHQQQQSHQQHIENMNNANVNNINDSNSVNHMDISNSTIASVGTSGIVDRKQIDSIIMQNLPMITATQMEQPPALASYQPLLNETAPLATMAAAKNAPVIEQQSQMANWAVSDVCEFIKNLPGCSDYVDDFEQQEIDGQALLLLKENHLVNAMGMKLGPALKIVAKVESMKEVSSAMLNAANNTMESNNANMQ